eukprot:gene3064-5841_t
MDQVWIRYGPGVDQVSTSTYGPGVDQHTRVRWVIHRHGPLYTHPHHPPI